MGEVSHVEIGGKKKSQECAYTQLELILQGGEISVVQNVECFWMQILEKHELNFGMSHVVGVLKIYYLLNCAGG